MRALSGLIKIGEHEYIYHLVFTNNKHYKTLKGSRIQKLELYQDGKLIIYFNKYWKQQTRNKEAMDIYNYLMSRYLKV